MSSSKNFVSIFIALILPSLFSYNQLSEVPSILASLRAQGIRLAVKAPFDSPTPYAGARTVAGGGRRSEPQGVQGFYMGKPAHSKTTERTYTKSSALVSDIDELENPAADITGLPGPKSPLAIELESDWGANEEKAVKANLGPESVDYGMPQSLEPVAYPPPPILPSISEPLSEVYEPHAHEQRKRSARITGPLPFKVDVTHHFPEKLHISLLKEGSLNASGEITTGRYFQ